MLFAAIRTKGGYIFAKRKVRTRIKVRGFFFDESGFAFRTNFFHRLVFSNDSNIIITIHEFLCEW